ncbi:glycosyltransferase [Thalassotalea sp. PLHSN55]|uniref:glycosyltransferase n=1 Tax=Thalassotalea sp. PLHSN55 TaxID=3435888 RepID=UPI003F86518B
MPQIKVETKVNSISSMSKEGKSIPLVGLISTTPNIELLLSRCLPSVSSQTTPLDLLIIVSDKRQLSWSEEKTIRDILEKVPVIILQNKKASGAAGSWNTGLSWIYSNIPDCYVSIIDDDDTWDSTHLGVCWSTALQNDWPDIVISGLRLSKENRIIEREIITQIKSSDFLTGNPGWQGTNTFVKSKKLEQIGGFTDGLSSCNDRDLAVRLLDYSTTTVAFTNQFTATWYCGERKSALSAPGASSKLNGLAQFLLLHQVRMSSSERISFFARAKNLFHISETQILEKMKNISCSKGN